MDFMERIEKAKNSNLKTDIEYVMSYAKFQIKECKRLIKDCKKKLKEVRK